MQLTGALGGLDGRDSCDREYVTLVGRTFTDSSERRCLHRNPAAGPRPAFRDVLGADVDHVRLSVNIEMGKMRVLSGHRAAPETLRSSGRS